MVGSCKSNYYTRTLNPCFEPLRISHDLPEIMHAGNIRPHLSVCFIKLFIIETPEHFCKSLWMDVCAKFCKDKKKMNELTFDSIFKI